MEKKKTTQIASIVIACCICSLSLLHCEWIDVGISNSSNWHCRLTFHFFHANLLHAALNAWCLLCITFKYGISLRNLLAAFIIAASIPPFILHDTPTVGLSGVIFACLASFSFVVKRKLYFHAWTLFYIGCGFLFPNTNALLHLYCYALGFIWTFLNKPIIIAR